MLENISYSYFSTLLFLSSLEKKTHIMYIYYSMVSGHWDAYIPQYLCIQSMKGARDGKNNKTTSHDIVGKFFVCQTIFQSKCSLFCCYINAIFVVFANTYHCHRHCSHLLFYSIRKQTHIQFYKIVWLCVKQKHLDEWLRMNMGHIF